MIELAGCWVTVRCTAAAVVWTWKTSSAARADGGHVNSVTAIAAARVHPSRATAMTGLLATTVRVTPWWQGAHRADPRRPTRTGMFRIRRRRPVRRVPACSVASRPKVVAHRGASEDEAEHTLAAYLRALEDGADGLECDVRLTRDGVLVCVHDRRIDRTSSGRGVVSTLELGDLEELDLGSWHAAGEPADPMLTADWEAPDWDRRQVLTLERLLEVVADCGRPLDVAIETKHPTRYAGLVELALVELLSRFGLTAPARDGRRRARVMSFSTTGLRRVHALAPDVPTVHLMRRIPLRLRDGELVRGVTAFGPALPALRAHPRFVERVQARGGQVHVWTVDDPADIDFVTGLGVDVIITNRPGEVLRRIDRAPGSSRPDSPAVP